MLDVWEGGGQWPPNLKKKKCVLKRRKINIVIEKTKEEINYSYLSYRCGWSTLKELPVNDTGNNSPNRQAKA